MHISAQNPLEVQKMVQHEAGTALITGAAGEIGGAIAKRLSADGYSIACVDSNEERLDRIAATLGAVETFLCDVRRERDVLRVRDQVTAALGAPSLLVNAAGVFALTRVPDMSEEDWDWILDVNLKGTFLTCKAFLPAMIEARSGVIINIASTAGVRSAKDRAAYCASKGGVVLFTGALAADHGPDGVRINCVCPGIIDSSMASWINADPTALEQWSRSIPAGRMGRIEEVASVVAFLASEEAAYVHGATFVVDGGESK